ncbi:ESX secretion system protein EccC [Bienertia sinuspersici]
MRDCIWRADEMGLNRDSNMYIHGVRVLSSMNLKNWDKKLKAVQKFGFSEDDILSVFRKTPHVLAISEELLEVSELLLSSEGVDASYLVQHAELMVIVRLLGLNLAWKS